MTQYGCLQSLADPTELEIAKNKWLNKAIFAKETDLYQYDAGRGEEKLIAVPCGEPMAVTDVEWGLDDDSPIWVVIKTNSGRRGYYKINEGRAPVNLNLNRDYRGYDSAEASFFDSDPNKLPDWGPSMLTSISAHTVTIGMSKE